MLAASASITGGDPLADLDRSLRRLTDTRQLAQRLAERGMDSMKMNIEEGRSPEGKTYDPLVHPRPQGHPYGNKPLLDSTRTYQSSHYEMLSASSSWAGPDFDDAPYFPYQNQGAPKAGIVARKFIGIRIEDANFYDDIAIRHAARSMM